MSSRATRFFADNLGCLLFGVTAESSSGERFFEPGDPSRWASMPRTEAVDAESGDTPSREVEDAAIVEGVNITLGTLALGEVNNAGSGEPITASWGLVEALERRML